MILLKDTTLATLKCSKCDAYLSCAPIKITHTGSNICGRCTPTLEEECSTIRNTAYEEIAAEIIFPCRYRQEGCSKKLPWNNVTSHEENCDYRVYKCPVLPVGSCPWSGTNAQLLNHYKNSHHDLVLNHPYKLYPDLDRDGEEHFLMPAYGFLFLIQIYLQPSSGKLLCCVRYLGNKSFVSNFEFTLEIRNYNAVMKKTKSVTSRNELIMNRFNSIEVNLKTIVEFMGGSNGIYLVVDVRKKGSICFKCKNNLTLKKNTDDGYIYHCGKCDGGNKHVIKLESGLQQFSLINTDD